MSDLRNDMMDWLAQGRLSSGALPAALRLAGITPSAHDWRRFFDRLCLWLGTLFLAAAVVFFFAYNWQEMGRYAKFALVEVLIVGAALLAWRLDLAHVAGKAALLFLTMLIGALLALVGQTYQTGADTYELFGMWTLAVLPLVAVGRFGALWLVWLGLLNLTLVLYFRTFGGAVGWDDLWFGRQKLQWVLFLLDTAALCCWELCARHGIAFMRERWSARILAVASGSVVCALAIDVIFENADTANGILAYLAWLTAVYAYYRHGKRDVFMLAGGTLSAIIVATASLTKTLDPLGGSGTGGAFLLIGLLVIGMSGAAGMWLKSIVVEGKQ